MDATSSSPLDSLENSLNWEGEGGTTTPVYLFFKNFIAIVSIIYLLWVGGRGLPRKTRPLNLSPILIFGVYFLFWGGSSVPFTNSLKYMVFPCRLSDIQDKRGEGLGGRVLSKLN